MRNFHPIGKYEGETPGNDTLERTLYDSSAQGQGGGTRPLQFGRYLLSLQTSHAGTLKVYGSNTGGRNNDWQLFRTVALAGSGASGTHEIAVPFGAHLDIKVTWTNGGTAQALWVVAQVLDDVPQAAASSGDGGGGVSSVSSTQLPASLGQKTSALSMSVVEASDSIVKRASSLRGPIGPEVLPIAVGTSSETYVVPDAWKGVHVRIEADGGDLYLQISITATAAVADKNARAQRGVGSPVVLTAPASGAGAYKIPRDMFLDVPFPSNATTFALQGSAADIVARTHPAET
jgi:hypothetical protein